MKGNVIQMNTLHLNSVRLNGIGKVQSVSLKGGSTEDPVFPPVEPPIEPEPTPTYTLSASVTNGKVSATRNGSAVNLPFTANEGDTIVLEVTPNDGYAFEGWNDGNTDNPRSITMNADVSLSAQCVEVVQPPVGNYIQFEDAEVERVLMANGVSSDGVGITIEDAERVTSIGTWFKENDVIEYFDEFQYFTGISTLSTQAFRHCDSLIRITIPASITEIPVGVFDECRNLENVIVKGQITTLAVAAFRYCKSLKSIDLQSSIQSIAAEAFLQCTSYAGEMILPNCKTIGYNAFKVSNIKKVVLLGIQTMRYRAFQYCQNLEYVELGDTLTSFENHLFADCNALTTLICRATTPPTAGNDIILGSDNATIYVPDASLEAYKTATNWNQFADRIHPLSEIEEDNGVTLYDRLYGDGSAYIETDYFLKGNEMIESVQQNIFIDSANRALWGAVGTKAKTYCTTGGASNSASMQYVFYYGATSLTTYQNVNNSNYSQFRIKFTAGYLHIADRDYSIGGSRVAIDAPFHIFAKANDSAFWQGWIGQVVLSDENTSEVLAKFTPASYNGEAGMYDEISGKFYGNAATSGTFYVENE